MEVAEKVIRPKNKGTKVLSKNPVIEKLTRTHIAVPITMFALASMALLSYGVVKTTLSAGIIIGIFLVGFLAFTLVEYIMHRYLFHMDTDTHLKEKLQYTFHGVHHEYPKDKDRLAMPPLASALITSILFFAFKAVMADYVFAFLPGFILGYSSYLFIHFAVHAYQPPKNFLKILWINHGIHHYKNQETAFGVSSPLWDYIFRTFPNK